MTNNIFTQMEADINNSALPNAVKALLLRNLNYLKTQKVNVMITGATGCGKSSTINALFSTEVAKVGMGVDPETMDIKKFELQNLTLWDSPGLGDGKEKDILHSKGIINKLYERDDSGELLIDLVLVILDGSSKDLGTSYELINNVIIPNLGEDKEKRILIAINQADVAMKGRGWNFDENQPEPKLEQFLEEKVKSVKKRIRDATGVNVDPIYYAAGYQEEGIGQRPYNLSKLLYLIVQNTPTKKRLVFVDNIKKDQEMWRDNDQLKDYNKEIQKSFMATVKEYASKGADIGGQIGSVFGKTGEAIGKVLGRGLGAVWGGVKSLFGF